MRELILRGGEKRGLPDKKIPAWGAEFAASRAQACRFMLYSLNLLTEREDEMVRERIRKWVEKHRAKEAEK
jgi:hypothetical protein